MPRARARFAIGGLPAKLTKGQCGFIMGLTFSLVATIFFYKYFTMTTTLHVVEDTLSEPAIPFLQSLSHSTTATGVKCGGKWVRIYDLLSAAASGNSETVAACGTDTDLKAEVQRQLDNLGKISSLCFEYGMADSQGKDMDIMKMGDCKALIEAEGKTVKSITRASYFFPLPPENGLIGRQVLTKVVAGEAATPTPAPS